MKSIIMSLVLFMELIGLYGANYSVQFDIDELSTEVNSRAFHEFKLVNCSSTRELGYPKLPCRVVSYIIPANLEVNNLSISATTTFLSGTYTIMPVQTPEFDNGDNNDFTAPDSVLYNSNSFYPKQSAQIVSHSYLDGANHIVSILLNPLRYNPVTGVVEFANNISFSFSYTFTGKQPIYPKKRFAIDAPKYDAYLYNLVQNSSDITAYRNVPDIEIDPNGPEDFNYLIICPDDIVDLELGEENPFEELIKWKEQKGHRVRLMTYTQIANHINAGNGDDIGTHLINDIPGKVRKYLKHQWQNHGLANVLIVGGKDDPFRYAHKMSEYPPLIASKVPSDLYYADFNGDWNNDGDQYYGEFGNQSWPVTGSPDNIDYLQEVFTGRVIIPPIIAPPAGSPTRKEAIRNWSEKLITYEKGPNSGFVGYTNIVYYVSASVTTDAYTTLTENCEGFIGEIDESELIGSDVLIPSGATVIHNIGSYFPGIVILAAHGNKCRMRIADMNGLANSITSLDSYIHPSYGSENEPGNGFDNLPNQHNMYPLVIAKSCNTGQFDYGMTYGNEDAYPSMAEAFTTFFSRKGGPLWMGNTRVGYTSSIWENSFVTNIFASYVNDMYPEADPWNAGASFAASRVDELTASSKFGAHSMHYFGDPDMDIWSPNPNTLRTVVNVSDMSVCVVNGSGSIVENAMVVFQNDTQKRVVYTDNDGIAASDISFKYVSVFKHNHVPDIIRVIVGEETFSSDPSQIIQLNHQVIVPTNSTLVLDGNFDLDYKGQINVEGQLQILDNSVITGFRTTSTQLDGNKIIINGSLTCGTNVTFEAPTGRQWLGITLNELSNTFFSNCTFTRTPIKAYNTSVNFNACFMSHNSLTAIDSNLEFDSCSLDNYDTNSTGCQISILDTDAYMSNMYWRNSTVSSFFNEYVDSSLEHSGGELYLYADTLRVSATNNYNVVATLNSTVSIDQCGFTRTSVICSADGLHSGNMSVSILNNSFNQGSVELFSIPRYAIINNNILDSAAAGLTISYSGMGGESKVANNTIENCEYYGVRLLGTYCDIVESNKIQYNDYSGIQSINLSSWSLIGSNAHNYAHQIIRNNAGYQIYVTSNSTPDILIYNSIQNNNHNAPWVKIAPSPNDLVDVRYNYWGNDFHPEHDLSPFASFEFEPIWIPGNVPYIEETTAATLYRIAYNHEIVEEYVDAIADYKQLISEFPDTEYAALAAKALLRIEDKKGYKPDWNSDYTALKTYYKSENNLRLTEESEFVADCLATKCDIRLENYVSAINFYESVIDNPPSFIDSLCAIIDLGYVYLLMDESKNGDSFVGKKPQFKVSTYSEWRLKVNSLLATLDNDIITDDYNIPNTISLAQNYPNPFNPSTTISFYLPSNMACKLEIYNIRGQKVHTLLNENMMAGKHSVVWGGKDANGRSVSSGVYFYRLVTPNRSQTSKMLLMK